MGTSLLKEKKDKTGGDNEKMDFWTRNSGPEMQYS